MSLTPDAVIHQWFKQVWDEGREEAIDRLAAPDLVAHGLSGSEGPMRGTAAFKELFRTFREALGDLQIEIGKTLVQGDLTAVSCVVKGRHIGHAFGAPPTNKPVTFHGVVIARVVDGRIVEGWNAFDFLTMYQQIGWVKTPPLP